jgi:hypothetical protein
MEIDSTTSYPIRFFKTLYDWGTIPMRNLCYAIVFLNAVLNQYHLSIYGILIPRAKDFLEGFPCGRSISLVLE